MTTANRRRRAKQPVAAQPLDGENAVGAVAGVKGVAAQKQLTPNQCVRYLRRTVSAAYRDIVAGFVDEAKSGSCQHLKIATEIVESNRRPKAAPRVKSAATLMLEKLEREFPNRTP